MKYPHIQQHDERDCGAACLAMITKYYGSQYPIARFRELIKVDNQGANIYGIVTGAKQIGFESDALEGTYEELTDGINNGDIIFPFIARIVNEYSFEHYIVVYAMRNNYVVVGDPGKDKIRKIPLFKFQEQWQGQIVIFEPTSEFKKENTSKGTLKRYFHFITNQKKYLGFIFIISLIIAFMNISGSVLFQYVLEDAMSNSLAENYSVIEDDEEDHSESRFMETLEKIESKLSVIFANLKTVCISLIGMYLLRLILQITRGYLLSLTAKKVDVPLTLGYYNHLTDLPMNFYGTRKTGEFMSRFNDTGKIREAVSTTTLTIMLDTIMAIVCGVMLFYISSKLLLITLFIIVVYAIIMLLFKKPIKSINHLVMEDEARVTSYLKESIDGIETVKSYNFENQAKAKTFRLYNGFADKNVMASVIYIIQEALVSGTEAIGIVILLWTGALLCVKDIISISDLIIYYYLINYFLDPVKNLINLQPELQTAMVAAERLNDILDAQIENNQKQEISSMITDIQVDNIDFRYGNRELVLKDVSMIFKAGSKTAIVGETGCGKTTLIKLLMSFDKPEKGSITVNGKDIRDYSPDSVRKRISYISQDIFLFSDNIYNNLRMGNEDITNNEIESTCHLCGIDNFIRSMPMGYDTILEENGNNLSGGQKQRLAIARALLRNPDVLIMDEATSNLDTITENSIKAMIENFSNSMTCIIIAHRLNTIRNCDYIYVMDKGEVAEEGTHEELLRRNGLYRQFTNQQ